MNLPDVNEAINQALEVAQNAPQTSEVSHEGRNAVVVGVKPGAGCGGKSPVQVNSDTQLIRHNSNALEVADQGKANTRIGSLCVGDMGVSDGCEPMRALHTERGQYLTANGGMNQFARSCENTADSQAFFSSLDHFTNRITRCVDKKLGRETELAEVGQ